LRQLLEFARGVPVLPTPKGENILIITGAGGSGVLLSDSCVDNGLSLMAMPPDLDAAFRKFIPPFGAAGNPVDITGGEPPITYVNTVKLGLSDERIHSLILGYWHTIVTPPMVFARNMVEVKKEMEAKGFVKPIVASLAGDVEVEEAAEYLYQNGIPAYAYSTELPVEVLGAKYAGCTGSARPTGHHGAVRALDGLAAVDRHDGDQLVRIRVHLRRRHALRSARLARRAHLLAAGRLGLLPGRGGLPRRAAAREAARCRPAAMMIGAVGALIAYLVAGLRPERAARVPGLRVLGRHRAGFVYATCVNMVGKWYPERKGGKTGFVNGGFAYGSVPFIFIFTNYLDVENYGGVLVAVGIFLAASASRSAASSSRTRRRTGGRRTSTRWWSPTTRASAGPCQEPAGGQAVHADGGHQDRHPPLMWFVPALHGRHQHLRHRHAGAVRQGDGLRGRHRRARDEPQGDHQRHRARRDRLDLRPVRPAATRSSSSARCWASPSTRCSCPAPSAACRCSCWPRWSPASAAARSSRCSRR
jgi:hypothetical protein